MAAQMPRTMLPKGEGCRVRDVRQAGVSKEDSQRWTLHPHPLSGLSEEKGVPYL
ncbi:MAG: hypothetical protein AB3K77_13950 [Methanosarcinaceae archaeon]